MNGKLEVTHGVVSVHVPNQGHRDAAIVGEIAGIELAVDHAHVLLGPNHNERHADMILDLDMHPGTMEQLVLLMCEKLGWPAFNANEWREIARCVKRVAAWHDNTPDLLALAERMERA